ncbi:glycosyltransferase family 2 protein [Rufibacter latericius]|uniref:Glycosyltransferase n=1 Tax=Rufibacter latericius TaxID=2487040 RepID=A0A3M9MAA9_9BACT|nr:glycosyltransferase family 2 protein [Rufibacter latericius]RNI22484.1 glycosyltransferase [Rufibacter latericius]
MVSEVSILIPVHNQNVTALVEVLHNEAASLSISFEIRVYDDGSNPETLRQNKPLQSLFGVIYQELPQNLGRSQIRYKLAQEAQYSTLLFLDNDVLPVHQGFLKRYLFESWSGVVIGGVAYKPEAPAGFELRWKYGKAREEAAAHHRQNEPYQRVFSSNLLVPKPVFLDHFPQNELSGYGHEDTLFAYRLKQNDIPVHHLDNPVWHLGLEPADVFLLKTQQALHNLVHLDREFGLGKETKLFKAYAGIQKWKIGTLLRENRSWLFPLLKRNLISRNPSLRLFDLYRLLLLDRYLRG